VESQGSDRACRGSGRHLLNKLRVPQVDASLRISACCSSIRPRSVRRIRVACRRVITQIPARLSVSVLSRPSYVSFRGFEIHGRPLSWFKKVHDAVNAANTTAFTGCGHCRPPFAFGRSLADRGLAPGRRRLGYPGGAGGPLSIRGQIARCGCRCATEDRTRKCGCPMALDNSAARRALRAGAALFRGVHHVVDAVTIDWSADRSGRLLVESRRLCLKPSSACLLQALPGPVRPRGAHAHFVTKLRAPATPRRDK